MTAEATPVTAPEPPPPPTFDALPLSKELRQAVDEIGYTHPTPVQLSVWEPATRGKDAVVQARTGTGKTASFGLPIIDHIVRRSQAEVQVLVLCPTRELAVQVSGEIERLSRHKGTKLIAIYGGAPMQRQIDAIAEGAQVVVGTPGRVLDHIRRGTLPTKGIRMLVLDEADEMLSMGFERELTAILESLPPTRQTLLFSATLPPDIERMAKNRLKDPEFVTLSGDHVGALSIQHYVYMVTSDKVGTLVRILEVENPESAVIFCNTKDETETVASALQQRGFDADWLNGDLPQTERERVMTATRSGKLRFLVATDVAARGIDISHLTHVINYDFPQDAETYVHRTGRTGRAGRTGTAISLITPQSIGGLYLLRLTYKIKPIERQIPSQGELKSRAEADLVGMLAEGFVAKGQHPDDRALARRLLSHDDAERIVAGMLREYLGARPTAVDEASAARRAKAPRPVDDRETSSGRRSRRSSEREPGERRPRHEPAAPREAAAAPTAAPAGAVATVAAPIASPAPSAAPAPSAGAATAADVPRPRPSDDRVEVQVRVDTGGVAERPRSEDPRLADDERARPARRVPESRGAEPTRRPRERSRVDDPAREERRARAKQAIDEISRWSPPEEEGDDEPLLPRKPRASGEPEQSVPAAAGVAAPSVAASSSASADALDTDTVELFLSVGRRDGVKAPELARWIAEAAGIAPEQVRRVRVRDRNSFVALPPEVARAAVEKLHGTTMAGRTATVELARERPAAPSPEADAG